MRYYIHVQDGAEMLDEDGIELSGMEAVRLEAIQASAELLKGQHGAHFWSGEPWKLWVTDQPKGGGTTVLKLTFSAQQQA